MWIGETKGGDNVDVGSCPFRLQVRLCRLVDGKNERVSTFLLMLFLFGSSFGDSVFTYQIYER